MTDTTITTERAAFLAAASYAYSQFESRERSGGKVFVTLKDDAPEWLEHAVREAHNTLPEDAYRLLWCSRAVAMADGWDSTEELIDALSLTFHHSVDLANWLGSRESRFSYVDRVCREEGYWKTDGANMRDAIILAYTRETQETFRLFLSAIQRYAASGRPLNPETSK